MMFQSERKTLESFLGSEKYPTTRKQLIDDAVQKDLPIQLVQMFQLLEDRQYKSMDDIEQVLAAHKA
jgi:hypothetical protein